MCRHARALKFHVPAQIAIRVPFMSIEVQFMTAVKALASLNICICSLEPSSLDNAIMPLDNTMRTKISCAGS